MVECLDLQVPAALVVQVLEYLGLRAQGIWDLGLGYLSLGVFRA